MERFFNSSRLLVLVAVLVCAISSVLLYIGTFNIIINIVMDFLRNVPASASSGKSLAVRLLKILDLLLIAITFQIIAVSLYRLFIRPVTMCNSSFLRALDISNFHDLKITLVQVAVVIMVILFLEHVVQYGGTQETLYMGLGIGVVIVASVYAWKGMGEATTRGDNDEVTEK